MFCALGYKPGCMFELPPTRDGGSTDLNARDPGVCPRLLGGKSGRRLLGECRLGSTDCYLRVWAMRLLPPPPIGGLPRGTSLIVCSGYYFIFISIFYLFLSALSHLVTSKDAFAFCNLSNCFTFSIMSSLSFRRFLSLLRLEMERLCGRKRTADDLDVL